MSLKSTERFENLKKELSMDNETKKLLQDIGIKLDKLCNLLEAMIDSKQTFNNSSTIQSVISPIREKKKTFQPEENREFIPSIDTTNMSIRARDDKTRVVVEKSLEQNLNALDRLGDNQK